MRGGRPHGGAAPGQLDRGAGGSFFFGAQGGRGRAAVPLPPPQGAPRATVRLGGGAAEDCGLQRDRGQERTMSGKGVIIFHNCIVALLRPKAAIFSRVVRMHGIMGRLGLMPFVLRFLSSLLST